MNTVNIPDGRQLDLDYFVHWRPYFWRRPVKDMLTFLGDLRGRELLHIGDLPCRMTSLFALLGARVTLADVNPVNVQELEKWGGRDKVKIITTTGGLGELGTARFDIAVSKSVLWCIPALAAFLREIADHLRPGAQVAFVEDSYGSPLAVWLRRHLRRRPQSQMENRRFGIKESQSPIFQRQFDQVSIRRYLRMVYVIFGYVRHSEPALSTDQQTSSVSVE